MVFRVASAALISLVMVAPAFAQAALMAPDEKKLGRRFSCLIVPHDLKVAALNGVCPLARPDIGLVAMVGR